jgi:hypothetical protein
MEKLIIFLILFMGNLTVEMWLYCRHLCKDIRNAGNTAKSTLFRHAKAGTILTFKCPENLGPV